MSAHASRTALIAVVLLTALLGGCVHVTAFVATDPPDASMVAPFHSDAGRFSIDIPGAFTETVKTTENPYLGPIDVHYFVVTPDGGPRYAVVYGDFPSSYAEAVVLDVHYRESRDADVASTQGRLVESGATTMAGYPAEAHIIDGKTAFYRFVSVLVGTRGYDLSVRGTEEQIRSIQADRFLESFVLDAP
jgi:hypothetical protein